MSRLARGTSPTVREGSLNDALEAPEPAVARFWNSYVYWLPPALLGLGLTLVYLNPFIGDWDGLDYTISSLKGEPSPMALGRSLFTHFNFALYTFAHKISGVGPENAYLLFKFAVVAQVPLAIAMCWILARDLTRSLLAATLAALMIAVCPVIVLYGSQVMTEVPSLWLLAAALIVHLRGLKSRRLGLVLAGAALLGLAVNLRETNAFYFPWLVFAPFVTGWKFDRRTIGIVTTSLLAFILFAAGPFALWFALSAGYRAQWHIWFESGRSEAARHPLALSNLKPFFAYFFLVSPVVFVTLPFAFVNEWRRRGLTVLLLAAGVGLFANAILILNYSTVINWRYFVTGLPVLAPLAANYLLSLGTSRLKSPRRAVASITALILVVALTMGLLLRTRIHDYRERLVFAKDYIERLRVLPNDAVVMAGFATVAVTYWRGIGVGQWLHIGTGAGFPAGNLQERIEGHLRAGQRVFIDVDPRWWQPCSWQAGEIRELVAIDPHFRFRQVMPTIYEIRLTTDASATDRPHLEKLLPENRAEEVKKCF
ncbi:MAG TPA: glycosyltransferase family 39 protein [Pyrinomonadaceae bacterium]